MSEYRVWECQICGWIYDEAQGWPEDGIAPGTRWDEIPEDWTCPECGAAKQDFAMVEVAPAAITAAAQVQPAQPVTQAQTANTDTQVHKPGNRIWECMVCGWVYDESRGWPEDGIAPGTRWEDIPQDWCCPQCGVSKDDFDMVLMEEAVSQAEPAAAPTGEPLVIIGSGLAGYNLAREFRKLDTSTPLLLISADDGSFYSKPLLSASLAHGKTPQQLMTASAEDMARELNAEILVYTRVTGIDAAARRLTLNSQCGSQAQVHYGKLVLATGAACRPLPPIAGNGQECLFRVNSLADYRRFRTALAGTGGRKRVLLLGGGLIGCEFANDLIQSGFEVDVVDPLAWPLASLLPETAGRDLQRSLEEAGVRFHCNTTLKSLSRKGAGAPVTAELASGKILTADIALAALGLSPNTELAQAAGLEIQRGIAVDRRLQTSDPHIYALGDCAEVDGHLLYFVAPLVSCARTLAKTLAGKPAEVRYGVIPVAVKTTLRPTTVCPPPMGAEGSWHINASENGVQAEFRSGDGRLLGFALTGSAIAARETLASECAPLME